MRDRCNSAGLSYRKARRIVHAPTGPFFLGSSRRFVLHQAAMAAGVTDHGLGDLVQWVLDNPRAAFQFAFLIIVLIVVAITPRKDLPGSDL